MSGLLPVAEARARLLDGARPSRRETVPLFEAAGRVLAEPIVALRTQPPFDASAMDGYAVRAADIAALPATLTVIGKAPAGKPFAGSVTAGQAVRIFTGAPVPAGADTILLQEDARIAGDGRIEATDSTAKGRHIRRAGLDFVGGETLLEAGRVLDPAALSLAASANHSVLSVYVQPLVAILATGDELLPPGSQLGEGQIISSNAYGVAAIVEAAGGTILDLGIVPDGQDAIASAVATARAENADIIVTLGGASVGDHDLVRETLTGIGMELGFWKIAMRPGKPLMAGRFGEIRTLGLPGNPVASLVCSHLFLAPLVAALGGRPHRLDIRDGILGVDMPANDQREDYVRSRREDHGGVPLITPFPVQDSSMLKTLAKSDSLLIRDPFALAASAGSSCRFLALR